MSWGVGLHERLAVISQVIKERRMYKNVLAATAGSEIASNGVRPGLELAKVLDAHVILATVTERWSLVAGRWSKRRHKLR